MEKNNGKLIAIVALVIAVVSLSVGFAAFSATLTIDSEATLKATDEFSPNVNYTTGFTTKCYYTGDTSSTVPNAVPGTASGKTWSGVSVPITMDHKSVTCEAEISNTSVYIAYLKQISIASALSCASAGSGDAAATNVSSVCPNVTATVTVGSDSATFSPSSTTANTSTTGSIAASAGTQSVLLTVAYSGTFSPDGDVTVTIPTISLLYKTAQ